MDPATLGMAAASLLAPYLTQAGNTAAKALGDVAAKQVEALLASVKRKFGADGDEYAHQTLARLEGQPAAESRQRALADVLAEKAGADSAFKADLERLVQAAQTAPAGPHFETNVSGGQVGTIVQAGTVGTMNFGQPATPETRRDPP